MTPTMVQRRCTDPHCICTSAEAALLPSERGADAKPGSLQPVGPTRGGHAAQRRSAPRQRQGLPETALQVQRPRLSLQIKAQEQEPSGSDTTRRVGSRHAALARCPDSLPWPGARRKQSWKSPPRRGPPAAAPPIPSPQSGQLPSSRGRSPHGTRPQAHGQTPASCSRQFLGSFLSCSV